MRRAGWRRPADIMVRTARIAVALWWRTRVLRSAPARATRFAEELPDVFDPWTVYVVGEGAHVWFAALICPCGCRELLQMSLHPEGRPRWRLTLHAGGTVSLKPSVWRRTGCRSHFFLRRGRVEWCDVRSSREPDARDLAREDWW